MYNNQYVGRLLNGISAHRWTSVWFVFLAATFLASILVLNPALDPSGSSFSWPQLRLQFSYTPDRGQAVLDSWGPDAKTTYLSLIWIDILFALSYGPFFAMFLRACGASKIWVMIPLIEMFTNLVETSLEMFWVANHTNENPMFAIFLTHSIIATVKWSLVPFYLAHSGVVAFRALRGAPASPPANISADRLAASSRG